MCRRKKRGRDIIRTKQTTIVLLFPLIILFCMKMNSLRKRYEDGFYQILVHSILTASLILERTLSNIHSTVQTSLDTFSVDRSAIGMMEGKIGKKRTYWDPNKGSAIVVWAAGDQDLSQQLSLALASVGKRKKFGLRSGYPPYTVIVLVHENSDQLPSLISAWAKRKAEMNTKKEEANLKQSSTTKDEIEEESIDVEENESGLNLANALELLGLGGISNALGLAHSSAFTTQDSDYSKMQKSSPDISDQTSNSTTKSQKRRLSLGGWTAQDVVGYGRDMLKGLRIGEMEQTGIGAVIPVVVDITTPSGLQHAQSTIQAYCMSHDLLLRALILIPSIMQQNTKELNQIDPTKRSRAASSPSLNKYEALSRLAKQTSNALNSDVGETLNLLATLLPIIKHDGGRIIGFLPSEFRLPSVNEIDCVPDNSSRTCIPADQVHFTITRKALMAMWTDVRKFLHSEGIMTSIVHTIARPTPIASTQLRESARMRKKRKRNDGKHFDSLTIRIIISILSTLRGELQKWSTLALLTVLESLYGIPVQANQTKFQSITKTNDRYSGRQSWQATNLSEIHDGVNEQQTSSTGAGTGGGDISPKADSNCPSLLLESVKSALIRSWPRQDYSVGLGPHLEWIWSYVPGHSIVNGWFKELLLLPAT